jgi:regulatory protein
MNDRDKDNSLDFGQSYRKAADYCVIQDRCNSEIRYKLKYWNIESDFIEDIVDKLTNEGFLDEKRFAISFAGGKFRMNGWGKIKIASELRFKSVPADLIQEALSSIEQDDYIEYLGSILRKKLIQLGGNSKANRQKVTFYAASKGFEPGLIAELLKNTEITDL